MTAGKGWNGQKAEWRGTLVSVDGYITVGVCAREKKALSKHMVAITSRLNPRKFKVCILGGCCCCWRALCLSLRFRRSLCVSLQQNYHHEKWCCLQPFDISPPPVLYAVAVTKIHVAVIVLRDNYDIFTRQTNHDVDHLDPNLPS